MPWWRCETPTIARGWNWLWQRFFRKPLFLQVFFLGWKALVRVFLLFVFGKALIVTCQTHRGNTAAGFWNCKKASTQVGRALYRSYNRWPGACLAKRSTLLGRIRLRGNGTIRWRLLCGSRLSARSWRFVSTCCLSTARCCFRCLFAIGCSWFNFCCFLDFLFITFIIRSNYAAVLGELPFSIIRGSIAALLLFFLAFIRLFFF